MVGLKERLKHSLEAYAGEGLNSIAYLMSNEADNAFAVVAIASIRGKPEVSTGIVARIDSNVVIIERDMNDKPLVDALVQNGVPREQIILAYAGEKVASSS